MTAFLSLSASARAFFALWALLLCLADVFDAVIAGANRRYRWCAMTLALFAPAYLMWQMIFDLSLFGGTERAARLSAAAGALPWGLWLAALALLTLISALLLAYSVRYDRNHITPGTVKLFLDKIPCGVCCWRESGRVLLSNECMNRLCEELTGGQLLNGEQFRDAVRDGIHSAEGRVWRFSSRELVSGGERLREMIASDVTGEYARTQALEKDKTELSRLNRELREYDLSIADAVRRQEILRAKVNIHDEMNRLMLTTAAAGDEPEALDEVFSVWERNALLLCMEADEIEDGKAAARVERLAEALNIRLVWDGALPSSLPEGVRRLFFSAAQEAIANAAKHTDARSMTVSTEETETGIVCRFTNDGALPDGAVSFTGGLANLARLAEKEGAAVTVETGDVFTLRLYLPKNQPVG